MDLRDTPEEAAFRAGLRAWLGEPPPEELQGDRGGAARFDGPAMREWSRALYHAGYIGLTWPKEYGGQGAPYAHQAIFLEELARAGAAPHVGALRPGPAGPTPRGSGGGGPWPGPSPPGRSGARASPSQAPVPTWRACARSPAWRTAT